MRQRINIDIVSKKPINEYGDGHILIYDSKQRAYLVSDRQNFLQPQNKKIEDLENSFNAFKEEVKKDVEKMKQENESFVQNCKEENKKFVDETNKNYGMFLKEYQETNTTVINLIKSLEE